MRSARSLVLLLGGLLAAGCSRDDNGISGVGTVEYTAVDVAPLVTARVVTVPVREGEVVVTGQTVATLTNAATPPEVEARRAVLLAAEAQLRDAMAGARRSEIADVSAQAAAAAAEATQAARDAERARRLFDSDALSRQEMEAAQSRARATADRAEALRAASVTVRAGTRPEQIRAARAEVDAARAALDAAQRTAAELTLSAPVSGTVVVRVADPGEIVAAGRPVLTIARTDSLWVRIFVDQVAFTRIRLGDAATVAVDGVDQRFPARVIQLSDRAEFTPRIALTERERADLVFGVKLLINDTTGAMKAGLPVTARITPSARAE